MGRVKGEKRGKGEGKGMGREGDGLWVGNGGRVKGRKRGRVMVGKGEGIKAYSSSN